MHLTLGRATLLAWALLSVVSWTVAQSAPPGEIIRDFDHDGNNEKLRSSPQGDEILRWNPANNSWEKADFALPEGIRAVGDDGDDAGLRFVDLNGDGFDDILFSNPQRYAIYLWTKDVRPDLGWTRGWSQDIRSGPRTGDRREPPSLVATDVHVAKGQLVVSRPAAGSRPASIERLSAKDLIAFDVPPPKSPEEALSSFRVRPGFRVELVASEPVVVDPIAFDWGADGRLWVVEMRDYPLGLDGKGQPGGVVKILDDADGDGRYDKATVFLDGIAFPTSVMPWKNGALIAAAPDLFYAEDTNGDGRADVRRNLFTGFALGNQQHRFNGFEWGLDGWIFAANGDSGGTVKSLATGKVVSISGRDIRFRPETGELETVSAESQFGRRRDDWGNWFGNNNSMWLWHVTLHEHYLRRNPRLAVTSVRHVLANYENPTRVFPVSAAMVRPNQPWFLNHVTSACSPCLYRDDLFGADFTTSAFISEPVHNAVHREILYREGSGFSSRRAEDEQQCEFLASTDNWFRPITVKTGPDGALYIADMYRFVLEHPEWISPEMQARLDIRAGDDRGRLYRVVPLDAARRPIPNLAKLESQALVAALNSTSGWQRDTAQRLLVDRADPSVVEPLGELLQVSCPPQVRLQALATLAQLGALTSETLVSALADPHPAVRCEALRQSEAFAGSDETLFRAVVELASDGDASVRMQAAFSLGCWPPERIEPVLQELASRDDSDELLRIAIMSSLQPESVLFAKLDAHAPLPEPTVASVTLAPTSPDRAKVIADYAQVDTLTGDALRGRQHFQTQCMPCHRLRGEGHEVGPDLGMAGAKPTDWLLTAILDPNQTVEPRYRSWTILLQSGTTLNGIVVAETANNIVLRLAGGIEHAVLRSDIDTMEPSNLSPMPTGFESVLKPQDVADLLRWLRSP